MLRPPRIDFGVKALSTPAKKEVMITMPARVNISVIHLRAAGECAADDAKNPCPRGKRHAIKELMIIALTMHA